MVAFVYHSIDHFLTMNYYDDDRFVSALMRPFSLTPLSPSSRIVDNRSFLSKSGHFWNVIRHDEPEKEPKTASEARGD
jgi:hypothetical protein